MKERLQEIGALLLKRLDLVTTGLLLAVLVVVGLLFLRERGAAVEFVDPGAPPKWDEKLPNEHYEEIRKNFVETQPEIEQDKEALQIVENNMFDLKAVREQTEALREINRKYNQAERMFQAGDIQEAERVIDEILQEYSGHAPSQNLKRRIVEARGITPTPAAE